VASYRTERTSSVAAIRAMTKDKALNVTEAYAALGVSRATSYRYANG